MAKKTVEVFTSDLSDSPADETVTFSLNGKTHEIDLTHEEAQTLYTAFSKYVEAGRTVTNVRGSKTPSSPSKAPSNAATVRAWAESQGMDVPKRGRMPKKIQEAFDKAH